MRRRKEDSINVGRPRDPAVEDAILKAAFDLFVEHGLEGASIELIARVAGVSRTTIYRRWTDREQILVDAVLRIRRPPSEGPTIIARMRSHAIIQFMKDQIVDGLLRPSSGRLAARMVAAAMDAPKLLMAYRTTFIEPWRAAARDALAQTPRGVDMKKSAEVDFVLDLLIGAVLYRLVNSAGEPNRDIERDWVDAAFSRLGLVNLVE